LVDLFTYLNCHYLYLTYLNVQVQNYVEPITQHAVFQQANTSMRN